MIPLASRRTRSLTSKVGKGGLPSPVRYNLASKGTGKPFARVIDLSEFFNKSTDSLLFNLLRDSLVAALSAQESDSGVPSIVQRVKQRILAFFIQRINLCARQN